MELVYFIAGFICASALFSVVLIIKTLLKDKFRNNTTAELDKEKLQTIIKNEFVILANEIINKEQENLRKQNREVLEEKISPLTQQLYEFREKVENFNIAGERNTTKIVEQIAHLEKNNKTIEQETKNLVDALTKNQNIKGYYGENLIDTILQDAGMVDGIHYKKQYVTTALNLKDNEVHQIRPDFVINLPNNHHLIIDSKVTLTSYMDYIGDSSKINEFKAEIKKRISDLSNKNYQNADGLCQPDFVLMYIPIEPAVSLLYQDTEIIKYAYDSNIVLVGTASLLTVIRMVNQLISQEKQQKNLNQIVATGTNLYNTFVQLCEELLSIQKKLQELDKQFNTTINRFKRNSKNTPGLFSQVEKLKEYGLNTNKKIPNSLLSDELYETKELMND